MLAVKCKDVWVEPIRLNAKEKVSTALKFLDSKRPVVVDRTGAVVDGHLARLADPGDKIEKISAKVPALDPEESLFVAAQRMLKYNVNAVPVKGGRRPKYVTHHAVLGAIKATKTFAKREARTIMRPTPAVSERKAANALNVANKNDARVVPIVNSAGKLVSVWSSGSIAKKPRIVKEGTRLKLIADKVLEGPVVVINSHREPVGIIDVQELLELAAMYREFSAPIYYSGLDSLAKSTQEKVKAIVEDGIKRIGDIAPLLHSSVYLRKKGVWSLKIKVSTSWRTFMRFKEGADMMGLFTQILSGLFREVKSEKKKKKEFRQLSKTQKSAK